MQPHGCEWLFERKHSANAVYFNIVAPTFAKKRMYDIFSTM